MHARSTEAIDREPLPQPSVIRMTAMVVVSWIQECYARDDQ